jgi:hypothetical protein
VDALSFSSFSLPFPAGHGFVFPGTRTGTEIANLSESDTLFLSIIVIDQE